MKTEPVRVDVAEKSLFDCEREALVAEITALKADRDRLREALLDAHIGHCPRRHRA